MHPLHDLRDEFIQPDEKTMIFNFYNVLDKQMMQCFASIRIANISLRLL
jgi:hypothetical protein